MKIHTPRNILIQSSLILALALAIWTPIQAQSADPAEGKKMMEHCEAMKEKKQKMKAEMKTQDAELSEQIARMNRAPEDKKVGLMAGVITQMLEQRMAMNARKAKMEEEMMEHMMQHMQMGKESMKKCPMMKAMDGKSADKHKGHATEQK